MDSILELALTACLFLAKVRYSRSLQLSMPANRRLKRRKKASSEAGAFFSVEYSGRAQDAETLQLIIEQALREAYGDVGGTQYECTVDGFDISADDKKGGILHIPSKEQRSQGYCRFKRRSDGGRKRITKLMWRNLERRTALLHPQFPLELTCSPRECGT